MTVYVVQEVQGINIISATKFGEISLLLPAGQITFSVGPTVNRLRKGLSKFNDDDYLLLIGDPAAIGLATAIALDMNLGKGKLLKWDRQEKQYYPITVNIKGGTYD
tara:strand:+ start:5644 stop:5961 length:318 start_codon:yes stop_codon:yes gene_type:complete